MVRGGRKDSSGNKGKSEKERATTGISSRRAAVDEERCGKAAEEEERVEL